MLRITVDTTQHGQPGPYQDHVYAGRITVEGDRVWERLTEDGVKQLVSASLHSFTEEPKDGTMDSHFRPRLTRLDMVEEHKEGLGPIRQVWEAEVREPYTD